MDAPHMTPSIRIALTTLRLDAVYVVYPGEHHYKLAPGVQAVPLAAFHDQDVAASAVREMQDRS